jgi:uncharacterized protein (TIGR01244 family)
MTTHRISLLAAALLATACAAPRDVAAPAAEPHALPTTATLEPHACGSVARTHTLGDVFLASQPQPADFEQAHAGGIRTVINLRHDSEITDFDERATVTGLGMGYEHLPWNGPDELTDAVFDRARALLNTAERPILLHCGSANRVGALWLAWRALDGGLDVAAAEAEAKVVGLKTPAYLAKAKDYVARRRQ